MAKASLVDSPAIITSNINQQFNLWTLALFGNEIPPSLRPRACSASRMWVGESKLSEKKRGSNFMEPPAGVGDKSGSRTRNCEFLAFAA
jgi:hypothetical protein